MNSGTISGNTAGAGGGVSINFAKFIMNGGTISGNTANISSGGGVSVSSGGTYQGTFTMNGGTISGNTANTIGGGVYLLNTPTYSEIFRIVSGTIYGTNESNISLQNTAAVNGAALYVQNGSSAQYGNGGGTWINLPLTTDGTSGSYTDTTVKYLNGVVQP
jgi:hypothetical protein